MKKTLGKLVALVVLIMFVISSILVTLRMDTRPRTDDAFLMADIANLAPEVSGRIITLNITNNQSVHAGDVLFTIDPEPYQLRLNAAKTQYHLSSTTLARIVPLLGKGYVTAERIDEVRAAKDSALAAEALAKRDLTNTTVKAPFDGKIVGLNISAGEFASAGHPLFTMINTAKWYVVANFRETELSKMKKGAKSVVYVMSHPEHALHGHIDSVGWGVTSEDASLDNGLPRIPKTLNWVRLAQRFPVRIVLDNPPENLMRIGASAVVVVHDGAQH